MGLSEVQVFDGDGVIPPELQKLIEENERLRQRIIELERESEYKNSDIADLRKQNEFLWDKFNGINRLLSQPMEEDEGDTYHTGRDTDPTKVMMGLDWNKWKDTNNGEA
jgi:DNA repair exonuclease SbcCD ATPase subunit